MDSFDDFDDGILDKGVLKPFHTVKDKEKEDILDWAETTVEALEKQAHKRHIRYRKNLSAYKGLSPLTTTTISRTSDRTLLNTTPKFVVNHIYDMTETKVSQMTRLKPNVEVLPTNDEFDDKNAALAVKYLINHLWYINNMDDILQKMQRHTRIFGESYCFITWDKHKGDLHPMYVKARDLGVDLDYTDEEGNPVLDKEGNPIKLSKDEPVLTGDINYEVEVPWRVLLQRKKKLDDVDYCFRVRVKPTEDLKKEYPKLADKIKKSANIKAYDAETLHEKLLEDETIYYEFYHKKSEHCPNGYYLKFTKGLLLERAELPYSHGNLPFERITDIDIPEQLNGQSAYEMIRPIQNMHNNLSTLLAKNIYLTGHAKWVMPRGACKIEALGNDSTIVQYQGPQPPQLLQTAPNPPEAYAFRDKLQDEMGQVYGVHGVSRSSPPPGITAGVALQFLNEQEQERSTSDVAKHNNLVQALARQTIAVAGDYYQPDDGRMLRIVGKDNKYSIRHFDSANLNKDYDIRIQVGSALPESKAGKIQRIVEIMQMKPDLLSNERWVDLLEFGNTDKMVTLITAAVKSAESENEDIMSGKPVSDPQDFEDHFIHWRTHVKAIQNRAFKEECPPVIREIMLEHIAVHEYAMVEKAKQNPAFEAKLAQLPLFPIFPNGFVPRSKEHMTMVVQGQSNRGEQISDIVPGEEIDESGEPYKEQGDKK